MKHNLTSLASLVLIAAPAFAGTLTYSRESSGVIVGSPQVIIKAEVDAREGGSVLLSTGSLSKDNCRIPLTVLRKRNIDPVSFAIAALEKNIAIECVESQTSGEIAALKVLLGEE